MSVRASSLQVHVDSERASSSGSSQASLTRCVATIGGKTRGPPASRCIVETEEPAVDEPLRPLADDPAPQPDPPTDLRLRHPVSEQQDRACSDHVPIRVRHRVRDLLEHDALLAIEDNLQGGLLGLRLLGGTELHSSVGSRPSDDQPSGCANRSKSIEKALAPY